MSEVRRISTSPALTGEEEKFTVKHLNEINAHLASLAMGGRTQLIRPPRDLDRFYAVGVKIRTDRLFGVLVDVHGDLLFDAADPKNQGLIHELEATDVDAVVTGVADLVAELVAQHSDLERPVGLGVELSGQVDGRRGIVLRSHRMGWYEPVPLAVRIESSTGFPTMVEHDVKALALGEQMFGLGKGRRSFAVVTAGLGVGVGLVINHDLWRGLTGTAGELGHMVVDPDGVPCSCGKRGCLETVAGSEGIMRAIHEDEGRQDVSNINAASRLATQGDEVVLRVFQRAGDVFGRGLSWLANLLNPELIIVRADPALLTSGVYEPSARNAYQRYGFYGVASDCELVIEKRVDGLGARSAGSMVFRLLPDRLAELGDPWE